MIACCSFVGDEARDTLLAVVAPGWLLQCASFESWTSHPDGTESSHSRDPNGIPHKSVLQQEALQLHHGHPE